MVDNGLCPPRRAAGNGDCVAIARTSQPTMDPSYQSRGLDRDTLAMDGRARRPGSRTLLLLSRRRDVDGRCGLPHPLHVDCGRGLRIGVPAGLDTSRRGGHALPPILRLRLLLSVRHDLCHSRQSRYRTQNGPRRRTHRLRIHDLSALPRADAQPKSGSSSGGHLRPEFLAHAADPRDGTLPGQPGLCLPSPALLGALGRNAAEDLASPRPGRRIEPCPYRTDPPRLRHLGRRLPRRAWPRILRHPTRTTATDPARNDRNNRSGYGPFLGPNRPNSARGARDVLEIRVLTVGTARPNAVPRYSCGPTTTPASGTRQTPQTIGMADTLVSLPYSCP